MTPIDSMLEIKTAVLDLEKYLLSKDVVVVKRAQGKYENLIDRFFQENENLLAPQQHKACIHDMGYFLSLIESAIELYYLEPEN